jgi:nicotinamidase-related amidase
MMIHNTALILIDPQVNMFDPDCAVHDAPRLLLRLEHLLHQARQAQVSVVFVQHNGGPGDPDEPGTEGWHIHPQLQPLPDEVVIEKQHPNAFEGTRLHQTLQANNMTHLIIAGMQTEMCVDATCQAAIQHEYVVTVMADAHSTFSDESLSAEDSITRHNARWAQTMSVKHSTDNDIFSVVNEVV